MEEECWVQQQAAINLAGEAAQRLRANTLKGAHRCVPPRLLHVLQPDLVALQGWGGAAQEARGEAQARGQQQHNGVTRRYEPQDEGFDFARGLEEFPPSRRKVPAPNGEGPGPLAGALTLGRKVLKPRMSSGWPWNRFLTLAITPVVSILQSGQGQVCERQCPPRCRGAWGGAGAAPTTGCAAGNPAGCPHAGLGLSRSPAGSRVVDLAGGAANSRLGLELLHDLQKAAGRGETRAAG